MKIIYLVLFLFTCGVNASIIEKCSLSNEDGCETIPHKTGQKAAKKCAEYQELVFPYNESSGTRGNYCYHDTDSSILGGFVGDAHPDEFPHMALIGYGQLNKQKWCGGTLISDKFILTAKYCLTDRQLRPASYVALGRELNRSLISSPRLHKVKRVFNYSLSEGISAYNDIGLIELEEPVSLDHTKVPACLHLGEPVEDDVAFVTGWGQTSELLEDLLEQVTDVVFQKVILSKFKNEECAAIYPRFSKMKKGFDAETQLCYGLRNEGKDACKGFGGGPLQVKNKDVSCMYTVIGISSGGRHCGVVDVPSLYTRVAHYMDWIESIVWP